MRRRGLKNGAEESRWYGARFSIEIYTQGMPLVPTPARFTLEAIADV
jgi:hypothetical protein